MIDRANLKRWVQENLAARGDNDGNLIVWEGLEVTYTLDEGAEWNVSEHNYDPATGRSVVTLNAPLRGIPMLYGHLPHPHLIMDESLQDTNGRCVFVAQAETMNETGGVIEGYLGDF